ncbi:MAG TPA: 23S rRNA (guanosine(2251)-2'-O)-methyltransferase RlmB [Paludibacteraceae bacterium]|nr:23S rRNA (guanosine(2251)-2'-O)-methyltransferase RlmB [Paludibacteraceae bacterium]
MINQYKTRRRPEKEMIFGVRAVIEAIQSGKEIEKILLRKNISNETRRQLFQTIKDLQIPVQFVPEEKLNTITNKNHQGVIAYISPISYQSIENIIPQIYEEGRMPFVVVLDEITDVRNFGAIARTCEGGKVDAIIIPARGSASINADAIKTSAGALFSIPICRANNLENTLKFLLDSGLKLVAATEKADKNYTEVSYKEPIALVMGAEDKGIRSELLSLCEEKVRIPMLGKIESLNVSVAAGILIYEVVRQRNLNSI